MVAVTIQSARIEYCDVSEFLKFLYNFLTRLFFRWLNWFSLLTDRRPHPIYDEQKLSRMLLFPFCFGIRIPHRFDHVIYYGHLLKGTTNHFSAALGVPFSFHPIPFITSNRLIPSRKWWCFVSSTSFLLALFRFFFLFWFFPG